MIEKCQSAPFDKRSTKDSVRGCEYTYKEYSLLFRIKSSHQVGLIRRFRKHHEKAIAGSIQLTKMPVIQLSELSGENEPLCLKSPEKSQYNDQDHIGLLQKCSPLPKT